MLQTFTLGVPDKRVGECFDRFYFWTQTVTELNSEPR